jgi:hypothetical protein
MTDDSQTPPTPKKRTAYNTQYQRGRRAKIKAKAEAAVAKTKAEQDALISMPTQDWWSSNRATLTEEERHHLHELDEATLDQIHWMLAQWPGSTYLDPSDQYYVGLEEGTADMEDHVRKYGVTYFFNLPDQGSESFRRGGEFRERIRTWGQEIFHGMNATELWLKYGYLVAVPSQLRCDFYTATQKKAPTQQYVTLECSQCHTLASRRSVPVEIAVSYEKLKKPFLCHRCLEKENGARTVTGLVPATSVDTIFDVYHRVKDNS